MLGLVVGWLTPAGAPLIVAIDDTLFRRTGRHVHGAFWAYDGYRQVTIDQLKLFRGTTFVVAAMVVELPFLDRPIALPLLFRLWRPGGPTKPALARDMIRLIAHARRDRRIHVVADGAYLCTTLRRLPANVTLTGPLPRHAALWGTHPESAQARPVHRCGQPRVRGQRIGTSDQLAATTPGSPVMVTRYGRTTTVTVHERRCLWYGVFRSQPIRVLILREPRKPDLALVITDQRHPPRTSSSATRSGGPSRSPSLTPNTTGAGEARNRTQQAVERTAPFAMLVQTLVVVWYHLAGHSPKVVAERRGRAHWYTTKTHPSYQDMLTKLRRVLIAAQYRADLPGEATPEQIHTIRLAWANTAA